MRVGISQLLLNKEWKGNHYTWPGDPVAMAACMYCKWTVLSKPSVMKAAGTWTRGWDMGMKRRVICCGERDELIKSLLLLVLIFLCGGVTRTRSTRRWWQSCAQASPWCPAIQIPAEFICAYKWSELGRKQDEERKRNGNGEDKEKPPGGLVKRQTKQKDSVRGIETKRQGNTRGEWYGKQPNRGVTREEVMQRKTVCFYLLILCNTWRFMNASQVGTNKPQSRQQVAALSCSIVSTELQFGA